MDTNNDRIQIGDISPLGDTAYSRSLTINPIRLEDGGRYVCEGAVMGEFVTSQAVSETLDIVVFGKQSQYL